MSCCDPVQSVIGRIASPIANGFTITGNLRLAVSILLAGQSMMLGLAINLSPPDPETLRVLQFAVLLATLAVVGLLIGPVARSAVVELRQKRVTLDALFLTGMLGAAGASIQSLITGQGPIYFEVISVLFVVSAVGKRMTDRSRSDALKAIRTWSERLATCRVIGIDGHLNPSEVSAVNVGGLVAVSPGETIAVDGEIVLGEGFIQDTPMSGEPFARVCGPGDRVLAGSFSLDAAFHVRAIRAGTERQVDTLLAAVERVCRETAPAQVRADRMARLLFPFVAMVALATFAFWTWNATWQTGLFRSLSVLLVACPCALGLATPLALWSAIGRLAERGLLVQHADFVERMARVDRVIFDKTGTLTDDECGLVGLATVSDGTDRERLLSSVAAVQTLSDHPFARAFSGVINDVDSSTVRVVSIRNVPGCGVEAAIVGPDGNQSILRLGRPEWFGQLDREESIALARQLPVVSGVRVDIELGGHLAAIALVSNPLRASAAESIKSLRQLDLPVEVMTGDSKARDAAALVSDIRVGLLPTDKLQAVEEIVRQRGRPLFVGDGMNDAGALAAAHAGIALGRADGLAAASAMATMFHGDLNVIPWAILVCRRATMILRFNLIWAISYNILGISLAAGGLLHPVAAAIIMVLSSLGVVLFSLSTGRQGSAYDCDLKAKSTSSSDSVGRAKLLAIGHGCSLAMQGLFLAWLARSSWPFAVMLVSVFSLVGWRMAAAWFRNMRISHWLDMSFGMLTFGNLGMVLGWWVDTAFGTSTSNSCLCETFFLDFNWHTVTSHTGMLTGMLFAGTLAMKFAGRRSLPRGWICPFSMFTGGNAGMVLGMLVGGYYVGDMFGAQGSWNVLTGFAGMTIGMLPGMLIGHALTMQLIRWFQRLEAGDEFPLPRL